MIELSSYLKILANKYELDPADFLEDASRFIVSNHWFGAHPDIQKGGVYIEESVFLRIEDRLEDFCEHYNENSSERSAYIVGKLSAGMPKTADLLRKYTSGGGMEPEITCRLADFLLYALPGELPELNDTEVATLLDDGFDVLSKAYGDILADFINWTQTKTKTIYRGIYTMRQYSSMDEASSAYDPYNYLKILYCLYNPEYIEENEMYEQATASRKYADTWLFLSLHFLCALRTTDLIRIPHPRLSGDPQEILDQVEDGTFPADEARAVLYSVVWRLDALQLTPHKTEGVSGVASIKFHVPESVEEHVGTLFAIAEAHFRIEEESSDKPLIRVVTTYEQITKNMGEDIGDLFLEANFRTRSANKSYLQMIYLLTDDILGLEDDFRVKGYILAALARSHKGSYGSFAEMTSTYLKDAKMNGYSPELVAREMFERGVLSSIVSILLKMVGGEAYNRLPVECQTEAVKKLGMSPADIERSVGIMQTNMKRSFAIVKELYQHKTKAEILDALHRIGNGEASSKCDGSLCLMTAMGIVCPYKDQQNCVACEYEIGTKTTLYIMIEETQRLLKIYQSSENELEQKRSRAIARDVIAPAMQELLIIAKEQYGPESVNMLNGMIKEAARYGKA